MGVGARPAVGRGVTTAAIRQVREGDLERVMRIEAASFADPWSRDSFTELVENERVFFAGWEEDGEPGVLGYVVSWHVLDEGEVANVAVTPEARGRGIGAALLLAALEDARQRGTRAVYLEVRESNAAARSLYERHGFTQVGLRKGYYVRPKEDALIMRRDLPISERENTD
ncbi:MAG: ribosomal-protein-alanine acetyltransferase [Gemmatimonadetes bacterium]|nr:ribosomal-protein-alanine acetyltransferase [Gemmatimonadota bacterium]